MWEETYEVALVVDASSPVMGTDLAYINETSKQMLNEGAVAGYTFISFEGGILIMKCMVCHNVDEGRTNQCTPHGHGRR